MGGIRIVPHGPSYVQDGIQWFNPSPGGQVFDETLALVLPRALFLIVLWLIWTFTWAGVTQVGLASEQQMYPLDGSPTGKPLNFWDQWYFVSLNSTAMGTNDIAPSSDKGRAWLSIYVLFTIAFLYAIVSTF